MPKRFLRMPDTHTPQTTAVNRATVIADLRAELARQGLDAFLLPRFDAYQGEYIAPHDERLAHVTGFTGSAGMAIVTRDIVAVFVDGRYTVQLGNQSPGPLFSHHHIFDEPPEDWLARHAGEGWIIGFDPMHYPPAWFDRFAGGARLAGARLQAVAQNPVDQIWADQPAPPMGRVTEMPLQYAGKSTLDKCSDLTGAMAAEDLALHVETQPDNIAWFLNVRGDDVAFNPMPLSFMLIGADGAIHWFVAAAKLAGEVAFNLPDSVRVHPPEAFLPTLSDMVSAGQGVSIDPDFSPVAVRLALEEIGARIVERRSALTLTKAQKNQTELEGLRACHIEDGVAWVEFSAWLAAEVPARAAAGNPLHEREAEQKMLALRQARAGFISESFNSISAAWGNAAMCHYATTEEMSAPILPENPYLLDSGGQYDTGTTDATRSFSFGQPRPEGYDVAYTAVFKAFYALSTLRFPRGTQGHHIDAICRRPLWDLGLDYDHGTGHGIGHRLSVHEHPQRIGKPYNPVDLVPGMVMSIEPGHYVADHYGIRIENLYAIVEAADGFLEFQNMTYAPIQTDMLITAHLSEEELSWLNAYHAEVLRRLSPLLSDQARAWAEVAMAPVSR